MVLSPYCFLITSLRRNIMCDVWGSLISPFFIFLHNLLGVNVPQSSLLVPNSCLNAASLRPPNFTNDAIAIFPLLFSNLEVLLELLTWNLQILQNTPLIPLDRYFLKPWVLIFDWWFVIIAPLIFLVFYFHLYFQSVYDSTRCCMERIWAEA